MKKTLLIVGSIALVIIVTFVLASCGCSEHSAGGDILPFFNLLF